MIKNLNYLQIDFTKLNFKLFYSIKNQLRFFIRSYSNFGFQIKIFIDS